MKGAIPIIVLGAVLGRRLGWASPTSLNAKRLALRQVSHSIMEKSHEHQLKFLSLEQVMPST